MKLGHDVEETRTIETSALVKLSSQDPLKNSFTAKIRDLSFERLAIAVRTKKPLLRLQQEAIFLDEALLSYEQSSKEGKLNLSGMNLPTPPENLLKVFIATKDCFKAESLVFQEMGKVCKNYFLFSLEKVFPN